MDNYNKKFKELVIAQGIEKLNENPEMLGNEDLHNFLFNEDYFVIGWYQAKEMLKDCDFCPFDAISELLSFEDDIFGETSLKSEDINSEKIVNLLAYYYGMNYLSNIVEEFKEGQEG